MRPLQRGKIRVVIDYVREPSNVVGKLNSARDAARLFQGYREAMRLPTSKEAFLVACLDTRHQCLAIETVSIGSLSASIVHPREVFRPAVVLAASAIVIAHNHPSGHPAPSAEDEAVTDRLREVGSILGIPCLDHVILGEATFYSFAEGREIVYGTGEPGGSVF